LLRFDGEPSPSHGFAVTWAEFKIGEPDAAPLTERPSIIIHEGGPGDGAQMRTFSVQLETQDRRVNEALGGDPYHVVVYAHGIAGACGAGVEKANDKWLRHRGWDVRDWVVTRVYGEVAGPGHPA